MRLAAVPLLLGKAGALEQLMELSGRLGAVEEKLHVVLIQRKRGPVCAVRRPEAARLGRQPTTQLAAP
jgi:hypothetical protein